MYSVVPRYASDVKEISMIKNVEHTHIFYFYGPRSHPYVKTANWCLVLLAFRWETDISPTPQVWIDKCRMGFRHILTNGTSKISEMGNMFDYFTPYDWSKWCRRQVLNWQFEFEEGEMHSKYACIVTHCIQKTTYCPDFHRIGLCQSIDFSHWLMMLSKSTLSASNYVLLR